jgi:hypothetical protein
MKGCESSKYWLVEQDRQSLELGPLHVLQEESQPKICLYKVYILEHDDV